MHKVSLDLKHDKTCKVLPTDVHGEQCAQSACDEFATSPVPLGFSAHRVRRTAEIHPDAHLPRQVYLSTAIFGDSSLIRCDRPYIRSLLFRAICFSET
jgi:hypothetical protein